MRCSWVWPTSREQRWLVSGEETSLSICNENYVPIAVMFVAC